MVSGTKRLLSLLLALILCVSLPPAAALAEEGEEVGTIAPVEDPAKGAAAAPEDAFEVLPPADGTEEVIASGTCEDGLTWTLYDSGELVISGTGPMKDYKEYDPDHESTYYQVAPWIHYIDRVTSLTVEEGITKIGAHAFNGTAINVPSESTLESVSLPETLTSIGSYAFMGSMFREIVFPSSLQSINYRAFSGCHELTEVFFRGSAPTFGTEAFRGDIITAYYPANDDTWTEDMRQHYGGTITWVAYEEEPAVIASGECGDDLTWILGEDGVLTISGTGDMWDWLPEQAPWYGFHDSVTAVSLPEGLTCIGNRAFWGCGSLSSVTIPYGVTHIGSHAFRMCSSLASVEIPASVTRIDEYVFYDCGKLTTAGPLDGDYRIRFGWADSIPDGAFYNCNHLTSITFPEGTTSIGKYAFWSCINLKSVEIPESVSEIGAMAFYKCTSLSSITIPGNVASIGDFAFQECKGLKSLVIEEGVTDLGLGTFNSCTALERVTLPDSLVSIGNSVFYYCKSLNNVTIPSHVISIEDYAFNCCESLTDITIPEGVTRIGEYAFGVCKKMTRIVFLGGAPGMGSNCFYDVTATAYYPADDSSWTEAVRQDYGGTLTWVPYTGEPVINPFSDVKEGKYYYEPVLWAYYHDPQITGGVSETEFGPGQTCTREQIVTFLWKAMGAPEPKTTTNPFTDVPEGKWYYKPVLWAVEKGITGGMDATHFGVGKPCTREQAMAFLWKACGSPEPLTDENPFVDVPANKYYYKAVLWAVENGITSGVDATHFGVGKSCTRGQIVTFLYKAGDFLDA